MKDESKRLFRSLERTGGRDGFDTIVAAAVATYGSLRAPSEHQARDFGRLVLPLWEKVGADTRRKLAAALSHSPRVPRDLVEKLLAEPVETSAPFLVSSPVLAEADIAALRSGNDARLRKLMSGRAVVVPAALDTSSDIPQVPRESAAPQETAAPQATEASIRYEMPAPHRARIAAADVPSLAFEPAIPATPSPRPSATASREPAAPLPTTAAETPMRPAASGPAATVRETLRRLVQPGRPQPSGRLPQLKDLVALSVQQDVAGFYKALAEALALPEPVLSRIAEDAEGERLAVAIKALGASTADALTILMMMKPSIGLDVTAFDRMTRYYRTLKTEDCAALAGGTRMPVAAPALQPQYQDLEPLARAAPRADFGRRKARPSEMDGRSRTG